MHCYIMPRFPKHMFEGGFLSYPQANTQPDFPKCHTPSSQCGQKGLQSAQHHVNNMRVSWWKSAPASAHWFDTWKHHTPHSNQPMHSALRHQPGLNSLCLPPWCQQQLSPIPDAQNSLSPSCGCPADVLCTPSNPRACSIWSAQAAAAQMAEFWQLH